MTEARDYEDHHDDLDNQDYDDEDTTVAIFEALPKAFIDEFYEYEPDERIRNQFR